MKYYIKIAVLLCGLMMSGLTAAAEQGNRLQVIVKGYKTSTGLISAGLFLGKENYGNPDKILQGQNVKIAGEETVIIFSDLREGEYAVAVYLDQNANGKLDKNFAGIPKEPYGFSNNARGIMGPPSFEDARVIVRGGSLVETTVTLK